MNRHIRIILLFLVLATGAACGGPSSPNTSDTSDTAITGDADSTPGSDADTAVATDSDGGDLSSADVNTTPIPALTFHELTIPNNPVALTAVQFTPDGGELWILDKPGQIHRYTVSGDTLNYLGALSIPNVEQDSDCGLLSLAFDPDFASNHFFYVGNCVSMTHSVIQRLTFNAAAPETTPASAVEIIRVGSSLASASWHNVGSISFDAQGNLWALFGDKTVDAEAQNLGSDLGALLQIIPNRDPNGSGYSATPGNPFPQAPDIYAYGIRSPWKGTLDSAGRYWFGDVGPDIYEEVNVVTAPGQNFGWPTFQRSLYQQLYRAGSDPLRYWDRQSDHPFSKADPDAVDTGRRVVWVGLEYAPKSQDRYAGQLSGRMIYGDFCAGFVRVAELNGQNQLVADGHAGHLVGVSGWTQGPDDYLYVVTYGNCNTFPYNPGKLYRVALATP